MKDFTDLNPTEEASQVLSQAEYARVEELCLTMDADVDSWFSSSVACCNFCIDEYLVAWPNAYRHDEGLFQRNSMNFSFFYEGSKRVRDIFAKDEFQRLLPHVACPRCLRSIGATLYAYELPFSVPEAWEAKQRHLAERAVNTPFLLLREPFANEIYDNLRIACSDVKSTRLSVDLFRGRRCGQRPNDKDFYPPSRENTREGRYNHAGIPVLYLATARLTCWRECRRPSSNFYVCRVSIDKAMKIVDLAESDDLDPGLQALIFSSLMSAPSSDEGWYQPQYVLTRFVADCVKANGIDGIIYPSVRCGKGNNLAILDTKNFETWLRISGIQEYQEGAMYMG